MIETFCIYTIVMFTMMAFANFSCKQNKFKQYTSVFHWHYLLPILLFTFVFGIRYDVGVDYLNYLKLYEMSNNGFEIEKEYLFKHLTTFFANNNIHFSLYFSLFTFLQIFFIYATFKNRPIILLFLIFILFTGRYFIDWMNLIRQSIAFCVFVYSTKYIIEKKILYFTLFILFASLFHKSAIILLLLYPFLKNNRDYFKNVILQLFILAIAFAIRGFQTWVEKFQFINELFLVTDYEKYINNFADRTRELNTGYGFYALTVVDIIIISFKNKLKAFYEADTFIIFYNIYFVGRILSLLVMGNMILERPILYLSSFKLVITSYLLAYLWKKRKTGINTLFFVIIIIIYIILFAFSILNGEENKVLYNVFW